MAKTTQRGGQVVKAAARRGKGTGGRGEAKRAVRRVEVTVGELIAAAFDVAGGEAETVAVLMSSRAMARATGRQFVVSGSH